MISLFFKNTNREPLVKMNIFTAMAIFVLFSFCQILSAQVKDSLKIIDNLSVDECLAIAKQKENEGQFKESSRYFNQAAVICWEQKNYQKAIQYYENSLRLNTLLNNQHGITGINTNLGMIYADMGEYEKSLSCFNKSLSAKKAAKDKYGAIGTLINISIVLNNLKRYDKSIINLEEALVLAREINDADQMKSCYGMLSETYEKAGNQEKMMEYFKYYRSFHEMVQKEKEEILTQKEKMPACYL